MISTLKEVREALEDLKRQYGEHPDAFWDWTKGRAAFTKLDALIAAQEKAEPIGFMSCKQIPAIKDSEDGSGVYIPMRKTPAGLFTLALYTAPQSAPSTSTAMTDDAVTPEYLAWLASLQPPRNGVGGNEAWNAGVAFAGQQLAPQSAAKP